MIKYKNISFSAKTFYGVKFEPGEIKSVPGYINSPSVVRVFSSKPKSGVASAKSEDIPVKVETRGRKKKSIEPVKEVTPVEASVAEPETKIEISKEETSDGN